MSPNLSTLSGFCTSGGSLVRSGVSVAEHEMTTRAMTTKTIHIDFIHRNFEVRAIAQRYADPGAEYHETVAQPDGSGWNAVSEAGL